MNRELQLTTGPGGRVLTNASVWSPDGEWIAFAAWRKGAGYDLYVVHPDGSGLQRVTRTKADEFSPSWVRRS